jgi:sialic acid synthase SpsE
MDFKIENKKIGNQEPCYIIAEIGINHNGKLDLAKQLIDAAVSAGANAVKFQKRFLNQLYKNELLNDPNLESQGFEILVGVLKEVEFGEDEYRQIIEYCKEKNITFLCTPWDAESVDFLEKFNVPAYKIASADMTNFPLLKYVCSKNKPMIISSGMSEMNEIEKTVEFLKNQQANFILLHCNSTYPSPIDLLNLELIPVLSEKFQVPIGYSGHEPDIIPTLTASNLGAVLVERHVTLDRTMEGIDQSASLEPQEFSTLVKYIRDSEKAKGKPIKRMTRGEILQREVLGKSLVCKTDIQKNEEFSEENIDVKGPAKGLSPQYYYDLLGKKSKRQIKKGDYIQTDDL